VEVGVEDDSRNTMNHEAIAYDFIEVCCYDTTIVVSFQTRCPLSSAA
jgi:hypothetical protein